MPDDIPFAAFIKIALTSMYKHVVDDLAALRGSATVNVTIDYSINPSSCNNLLAVCHKLRRDFHDNRCCGHLLATVKHC